MEREKLDVKLPPRPVKLHRDPEVNGSRSPSQRKPKKIREACYYNESVQLENITDKDGSTRAGPLPLVSKNSNEHVDHFRKVHSFRMSLRKASASNLVADATKQAPVHFVSPSSPREQQWKYQKWNLMSNAKIIFQNVSSRTQIRHTTQNSKLGTSGTVLVYKHCSTRSELSEWNIT